jgi:hypothetical protein
MIKYLSAALASAAIVLAPLTSAQAAAPAASAAAPSRALPSPCRTFTEKSARTLFGVSRRTHLSERQSSARGPVATRICTVRHRRQILNVVIQRRPGGFGMGFNCFKRPKLGSRGQICVSVFAPVRFTFVVFRKHGLYVSDGINATLPRRGKKIYRFALPQYRRFKG